jgi:hypothetical protein
MSSEWSWDWEWDGPEDNGPAPFNPVVVETAITEPDGSPSAQRRSALAVALAVVQSENSDGQRERVEQSTPSLTASGWTPPMWNPPTDTAPIWSPSVWPPPTGSLPVTDAISISIGGGSGKRRLKSLSSTRRNSGKRDERKSER